MSANRLNHDEFYAAVALAAPRDLAERAYVELPYFLKASLTSSPACLRYRELDGFWG
jgi:hypothetical protein